MIEPKIKTLLRQEAVDLTLCYCQVETDYGPFLALWHETDVALVAFTFMNGRSVDEILKAQKAAVKSAALPRALTGLVKLEMPSRLLLIGTAFQLKVWQALLTIPRGETRSYGQIAKQIGNPKAVRAVGTANGANPLCILVPCHRVIANDGTLGGYAWGVEMKRALLVGEAA